MSVTPQDSQGRLTEWPPLAFLVPSYKTPAMCAELLCTAHKAGIYTGCSFVLLLDTSDPSLSAYKACVTNLHEDGMDVGYVVSDGATYAGMVNRVAHVIAAQTVCVIDNKHLPMPKSGTMADTIRGWLSGTLEVMRVGVFDDTHSYPVLTRKMVERLGYVVHPLCAGRVEAEDWVVSVAANIGVASVIPDCIVAESNVDGVELIGYSDDESVKRTIGVLRDFMADECVRLRSHVIQ